MIRANSTTGVGEYTEISEYIAPIPETLLTKVRLRKYICEYKGEHMIRTGNTQNQPAREKIELADSEIVIVGQDEQGNQIAIIKRKEKKGKEPKK